MGGPIFRALRFFLKSITSQFPEVGRSPWSRNRFPRNFVLPPSGDGHVDFRRPTWLVYGWAQPQFFIRDRLRLKEVGP